FNATARPLTCTLSLHDALPIYNAGSGNFGLTYLKQQTSPDKIKTMLKIANFFAAPFGSEEWLLNYFGVKEVDFNFNADGAPVLRSEERRVGKECRCGGCTNQ